MSDIAIAIEAAVSKPSSVTVDGVTVSHRSDQISAIKLAAAERAVTMSPFGLRFAQIVPPGAT